MCRPASSLAYSPRRLVALMASTAGAPTPPGRRGEDASGTPEPPKGPSPAAGWRNLKAPMPLGSKIRLVVRNTAIKIKAGRPCCGHPGEPGC